MTGEGSVYYALGIPGSGKTWRFREWLLARCRETGWPIGIMNIEGNDDFNEWPTAVSVEEFIDILWTKRAHVQIVPSWATLQGQKLGRTRIASAVFAAVDAQRACVFGVDEIGYVSQPNSVPEGLESILITHRKVARAVHLGATTQYIGQCDPLVLQCASVVHVLRNNSARALERLEKEMGFDPEAVRNFKPWEYDEWTKWGGVTKGFRREGPAPDPEPIAEDEHGEGKVDGTGTRDARGEASDGGEDRAPASGGTLGGNRDGGTDAGRSGSGA